MFWRSKKAVAQTPIEVSPEGSESRKLSEGVESLVRYLEGLERGQTPAVPEALPPVLLPLAEALKGFGERFLSFRREVKESCESLVYRKRFRRIPWQEHTEVWAEMLKEVDEILEGLQLFLKETREWATKVSQGDLTVEMAPSNALKGLFDNIASRLRELLLQIDSAVDQVSIGASQVATAAQTLAQGVSQEASSMEDIGSSANEIEVQAKQNAEKAVHASKLVLAAREAAEEGQKEMDHMVQAMAEIEEASQSISKIIKVIDDIAFQTNILALNAAIEAARAGKYGKGFAVVAEEVRNLASRSAQAAKETAQLIEGAVSKARFGVEVANRAQEVFNRIVQNVQEVTELVGEIAASSNEQAQGVMQINAVLKQVEHIVQQTAATAEENASAAEELSSQANYVRELLGRFKLS